MNTCRTSMKLAGRWYRTCAVLNEVLEKRAAWNESREVRMMETGSARAEPVHGEAPILQADRHRNQHWDRRGGPREGAARGRSKGPLQTGVLHLRPGSDFRGEEVLDAEVRQRARVHGQSGRSPDPSGSRYKTLGAPRGLPAVMLRPAFEVGL